MSMNWFMSTKVAVIIKVQQNHGIIPGQIPTLAGVPRPASRTDSTMMAPLKLAKLNAHKGDWGSGRSQSVALLDDHLREPLCPAVVMYSCRMTRHADRLHA